jgi:TPR repeat protein
VKQDKAKAVELYERAHAAGHVKATYNLGLMYQRGEGVKQDSARAAEFYEEAHEKGYSRATYNLGKMYELGVGVERDSVKASDLFQQVATCADDAEGRFASRASLRKYLKKSHVFTIDVVHRND